MASNPQLFSATNSVEALDQVRPGNLGEAGWWRRFALAAEGLAGEATIANETIEGWMLRAALALEAISGTSGAEENSGYEGLLKRIVDALEGGSTGTGSLGARFMAAAASFVAAPVERRNTYLLVIGQSNGVAAGTTAANMVADGTSIPSDITAITATGKVKQQYWNGSAFAVANYAPATGNPGSGGFSSTVAAWGPEAGFASAWLAEQTHPDSLLFIQKVVVDSSNLGQFVNPSTGWSWIGAGTGFIANMKTWATANSVVFDDFIVLFVNCESEGTNSTYAAAAEARLTQLHSDLRATGQLGANAKMVQLRLPNNPASYSQLSTVRTAQANVAALNAKNFLIDTDDQLPYRDAYHFKAPSIAALGARAYAAAI